jgi:CheY-like chemotaxis protein
MIPVEADIPAGTRVLCVDDESSIGELVGRILRRQFRCEVTTASNGEEALMEVSGRDFDAVIVDYLMPSMDGIQLYRTFEAHRPDLVSRLLFITGDTLSESTLAAIRSTGRPLLTKPFGVPELKRAVASLLAECPPGSLPN